MAGIRDLMEASALRSSGPQRRVESASLHTGPRYEQAMDAELHFKASGPDFAMRAAGGGEGADGGEVGGGGGGGGGGRGGGGEGAVDLDLNLVQNMLKAHSAQGGLSGPAASLLGSLGVVLPADADAAAEKEEAAGGGQEV